MRCGALDRSKKKMRSMSSSKNNDEDYKFMQTTNICQSLMNRR